MNFVIMVILAIFLGDEADNFVAAAGHYGNKSHQLVKIMQQISDMNT